MSNQEYYDILLKISEDISSKYSKNGECPICYGQPDKVTHRIAHAPTCPIIPVIEDALSTMPETFILEVENQDELSILFDMIQQIGVDHIKELDTLTQVFQMEEYKTRISICSKLLSWCPALDTNKLFHTADTGIHTEEDRIKFRNYCIYTRAVYDLQEDIKLRQSKLESFKATMAELQKRVK